ncbi:hypothetical protein MKEN_00719500 [Mycena kentingensis (nom. inval.)]|nr:hypothetical protein MKEN_00719500 [Mycena kentingensis (nom. inval.)]
MSVDVQATVRNLTRFEGICSTAARELMRLDEENSKLRLANEEVQCLREENSMLKDVLRHQAEAFKLVQQEADAVGRLRRDNAHWKERSEVLAARLRSVPLEYRPREWAECPHEILLLIFHNCLAPGWLLRGTRELSSGWLYGQDMKMKTALCLVCKAWNPVANELLYEQVRLRSIGQVVAFAHALQARCSLGNLVTGADISCFVPRGYRAVFESETQRIVDLCPRLTHFGAVPVFLLPGVPFRLPKLNPTITSLEFTTAVDALLAGEAIAQLCGGIRSLCCTISSFPTAETTTELEFPALEHLVLRLGLTSAPMESSLRKWAMPALRKLSMIEEFPNDARLWATTALSVLKAYGTGISTLTLKAPPRARPFESTIPCSKLQHLVLASSGGGSQVSLFIPSHPTVRLLDVWCNSHYDQPTLELPRIEALKAGFPALEACRFLDVTFAYLTSMPFEFPPEPPVARRDFEVLRPESVVMHMIAHGQPTTLPRPAWTTIVEEFGLASVNSRWDLDEPPIGSAEWEPDAESDGEWLPPPRDGAESEGSSSYESDTDSCSMCDSSGAEATTEADSLDVISEGREAQDEFYAEEDWQVTREEALAIFSGIVNS